MLSNHDSIVTDEDLRGRNILHFNLFQLLRDCSTIGLPPIYVVAMSLYQIIALRDVSINASCPDNGRKTSEQLDSM